MSAVWRDRPLSVAGATVSDALVADVLTALLRGRGTITRRDIRHDLNLKLSAISKAVKFLIDEGFVTESRQEQAGPGRPVSSLAAADRFRLIGLYLSDVEQPGDAAQSRLFGAITSLDGRLVGPAAHTSVRVGLDLSPERRTREVAADVVDFIDTKLLPYLPEGQTVVGVSLTLGGQVREGKVLRSYNMAWDADQPLPLRRRLRERLPSGVDVVVDNEASSLADRAWWFGEWDRWFPEAAERPKTFLAVLLTPTGVGGGFYVNGRRFEGGTGANGEIGHVKFDRSAAAEACRCGRRGCVEVYAAPDHLLAAVDKKDLHRTAASEDKQIRAVFGRGGRALGAGIASFINNVGPDAVVVFAPEDMAGHWLPAGFDEQASAADREPTTAGASYWLGLREALRSETFPGGESTPVAVVGMPEMIGTELAVAAAATALDALIRRLGS